MLQLNDSRPLNEVGASELPVKELSLNKYFRERLRYVQEEHKLTKSKMAEIAGFERSAWHRLLNATSDIGLDTLDRFIAYFGYPTEFWLPPKDGLAPLEIKVTVPPDCVCEGHAPLTKEIVQAIGKLSAVQKYQLLELLTQDSEHLGHVLELTGFVASVAVSKRRKFIGGTKRLATMVNEEPVPP